MFISELDNLRESFAAAAERSQSLSELVSRLEAVIQEKDAQLWELQQQLFALRYPEMWANILAHPQEATLLGVTGIDKRQ